MKDLLFFVGAFFFGIAFIANNVTIASSNYNCAFMISISSCLIVIGCFIGLILQKKIYQCMIFLILIYECWLIINNIIYRLGMTT